MEALRFRASVISQLRGWFEREGCWEVETPILSADIVVDRHLDPLATTLFADARNPASGPKVWLQTSPEFHMKRLLAAGSGPIFQFARAFRGGESGPRHNPEFTLLEWYFPGDDYAEGMGRLARLAEELLGRGPAELLSVQNAFRQYVGVDPFEEDEAALEDALRRHQIAFREDDEIELKRDLLLTELVEPRLGRELPTILYDYPASQAALAIVRRERPPVAERFELYVDGVELANGYHELLDPRELAVRNAENNAARVRDGKRPLPESSRLLSAMEAGLPPAVGVALGVDRLVMLLRGATTLEEVTAFPVHRA